MPHGDPSRLRLERRYSEYQMIEATRIAYGDDPSQFGDLRLPATGKPPHPVAIVVHGGFWRARYGIGEIEKIAVALPERGIASWSIEYRRVGHAGGGWPGTLKDASRAADYLLTLGRAHPLDLMRVVSIGHSAGGHLALWLAGRQRLKKPNEFVSGESVAIRGVVSLAGVCDLRMMAEVQREDNPTAALLGGSPAEVPERYAQASPAEMLPLAVPQILLHGDLDDCVPVEIGRDYAQRAAAAGDRIHYVEFPGTGHFELVDPKTAPGEQALLAVEKLIAGLR